MTVYEGRPKSNEGRLEKEIRVYDFLDNLGIKYYRIDHNVANTMDECETLEVALETVICKNLFLCNRQKTDFYILMMPAAKPFKTKDLSHKIGTSRLSFADPCFMEEFLDVTPGSVSIMGLMNDKANRVRLIVDVDVLKPEYVGCHPCINTSSLKIKREDVFDKYLKAVHHKPTYVELDWDEGENN